MKNLTPSVKRDITKDWHSLFPQMGIYKPMWLARRVGPLVQGICLDRTTGNTAYFPTTHIHNLCKPFPVVSLNLGQRLLNLRSGVQERISVQFHKEHYREAAQRLATASLLRLDGDLTLGEVLSAFRAYQGLNRPDSKYPVNLMEAAVLLLSWAGELQEAASLLNAYRNEISTWPINVTARDGGVATWYQGLVQLLQDPEALRTTADAQARELKVADLPTAKLLV